MSKIAIIILHSGKKEITNACLASVGKLQTKEKIKIFLVDNATHAFTQKEFANFPFPINLIENKINLGFAKGNNIGIAKALSQGYQYMLLLNDDTEIHPALIDELLRGFENKNVGIVGSVMYYKPNHIWFAGGKLSIPWCITRHTNMDKNPKAIKTQQSVDFISGAAMMIRKEVFKQIGLLPEDYFLYWEDVDFCYKARLRGFVCLLIPKPLVFHKVSSVTGVQGTKRVTPKQAYYYGKDPFIFAKKYHISFLLCLFGQLFIYFPFYLFHFTSFTAFLSYVRGFFEGITL